MEDLSERAGHFFLVQKLARSSAWAAHSVSAKGTRVEIRGSKYLLGYTGPFPVLAAKGRVESTSHATRSCPLWLYSEMTRIDSRGSPTQWLWVRGSLAACEMAGEGRENLGDALRDGKPLCSVTWSTPLEFISTASDQTLWWFKSGLP